MPSLPEKFIASRDESSAAMASLSISIPGRDAAFELGLDEIINPCSCQPSHSQSHSIAPFFALSPFSQQLGVQPQCLAQVGMAKKAEQGDGEAKGNAFSSWTVAGAAHLVLLLGLSWFWQQAEWQRVVTESAKPKALQSYLYFSQPSPKPLTPVPEALAEEAITQPKEAIEVQKAEQQKTEQQNTEQQKQAAEESEQETEQVAVQDQKEQSIPKTQAQSVKPIGRVIEETKNAAVPAPERANDFRPQPAEQASLDFSSSALKSARKVLQHSQQQALQQLSQQYADKATGRKSLSEMDGEMEVLWVNDADDFNKVASLDLPLDPNRIVKDGDTCYRVVKVPTPLNPYAENLGFPFKCGQTEMEKALKEAVASRLKRLGK
ncbi:hypothetical protein AYI81_00730 [Shewanella algae]|uniref:hypothetical protein n=2 Tax=Shewanella algae TaxID=38313 RepID=UPI00399C280E|nr:hypothetical protein AYI80_00730 [Shewanella algae]TXS88624.1 hypothetical protein AYI81_00730 [Shewanella algae]